MSKKVEIQDLGFGINSNVNPSQPPLCRGGVGSALPLSRGSWRGLGSNGLPRQQGRGTDRGFSLIELIIAIAIISILMSVFLDRVWYYQEMAEKTAMEENVGAIQSALTLQASKNYTRNNQQELAQLAQENPVRWLQKLPKNYSGEFFDPTPSAVAPGSWVFDLKARELIYVLDRAEYFVPGKDGKKWIRFHVSVQHDAVMRGGENRGEQELVATVFEPTTSVNWFLPAIESTQ